MEDHVISLSDEEVKEEGTDEVLAFEDFGLAASSAADDDAVESELLLEEGKREVEAGERKEEEGKEEESKKTSRFYSLSFWKQYFNVGTSDVLYRLRMSVFFLHGKGFLPDVIGTNSDLYGPVWIATTTVLVLAVASSLANWTYDFEKVVLSAILVFGYSCFIPTMVWLALRYASVPLRLVEVTSLYGYAGVWTVMHILLTVFLLAFGAPLWVKWVVLLFVILCANTLLVLAFSPFVKGRAAGRIQSVVVLGHTTYLLVLTLVFF